MDTETATPPERAVVRNDASGRSDINMDMKTMMPPERAAVLKDSNTCRDAKHSKSSRGRRVVAAVLTGMLLLTLSFMLFCLAPGSLFGNTQSGNSLRALVSAVTQAIGGGQQHKTDAVDEPANVELQNGTLIGAFVMETVSQDCSGCPDADGILGDASANNGSESSGEEMSGGNSGASDVSSSSSSGNSGDSGNFGDSGGSGGVASQVWHPAWDEWVVSGRWETVTVYHEAEWGERGVVGSRCDCGYTTTVPADLYKHQDETEHGGYVTGVIIGYEPYLICDAYNTTERTWVNTSHWVHHDAYWK